VIFGVLWATMGNKMGNNEEWSTSNDFPSSRTGGLSLYERHGYLGVSARNGIAGVSMC